MMAMEKFLGIKCTRRSDYLLLLLLLALSFGIFVMPASKSVLCLVLAGLMAVIVLLTPIYYVVPVFAVMWNSSLGTVIGGSISFPFFAMALLVARAILNSEGMVLHGDKRWTLGIVIAVLYFIHYFFFQASNSSLFNTIYMTICMMWAVMAADKQPEGMQNIYGSMALASVLSGVHCLLFGGVLYYEATSALKVARMGVIGAGAGDPVFSGMYLLIGFSILLCNKQMYMWVRLILMTVLLAACIMTVSTTVIIGLLLIVMLYQLINGSLKGGVAKIFIFLIFVGLLLTVYMGLPQDARNEQLDAFLDKTIVKFEQFASGDFALATTNRSSLASLYLNFYNRQDGLSYFFGGNRIPITEITFSNLVSHNTYIDLLLRFGLVGTLLLLCLIGKRCFASYHEMRASKKYELFTLKMLFIFYSYSLSIYYGPFFALWFVFLILL